MAHHPDNRAASGAPPWQPTTTPALFGGLALLVASFLLVVLGPVLLPYFHIAMPDSFDLATRAAAAGLGLGGAAAMMVVLSRLVREIERHLFACVAPVVAAFSGCVLWGLNVELRSVQMPLAYMGLLGLGVSVAAGAAISRGALGARLVGWLLSLFAPIALLCLLWVDSGKGSASAAFAACDSRTCLAAALVIATSLVLALFAEASRSLHTREESPAPDAWPVPDAHVAASAVQPDGQPSVVIPAPSLHPGSQQPPQPAPSQLASSDEVDFHALLRPGGHRTKLVAAAALVGLTATVGAWAAWRSPANEPTQTARATDQAPQEHAAPAASAPSVVAPPMAAEPRNAADLDIQPIVERLDTEDESAVSGTTATADAVPEGDEEPASAEAVDDLWAPAKPVAPKTLARERKKLTQDAATHAESPQGARAKQGRRDRERRARLAKQNPAKGTPAPKVAKAPSSAKKPEPKAAPSKPVDDSIESLMEGAMQGPKKGGGAANDPIFGL